MEDILNEPIQVDNPAARQDVVQIAILVDESGSMLYAANDTIRSVNSYIDEQATSEKEILISVYTFNDDAGVRNRFSSVDAKKAPHLGLMASNMDMDSNLIYSPSGGTPLYDAIATVITKETSTIPTLVVILTDGCENASREYPSRDAIQAVIHQQEESGWSFVFLMAGLDRAESVSYTKGLMGREYIGATMNYAKGTEDIAFQNLYVASASWETSARTANALGVVLDSVTATKNFFSPDVREIKQDTTVVTPTGAHANIEKKHKL